MKIKWLVILVFISCSAQQEIEEQKINGLCLVAPSFEVKNEHYDPIVDVGANWVAIIPYAFCSPENPEVRYDLSWQWIGEKTTGVTKAIQLAKSRKLKVLLKPHIWVKGQGWAGDLKYDSENDIKIWQDSYAQYLLHFAKIAKDLDVEMISIGTEIRHLANRYPNYWIDLISQIRKVYSGQITYSANWDNYHNINFWDKLDFIGIDAYFPLSEVKSPKYEEISKRSEEIKSELQKFSNSHLKKVLFTEFGFKSSDYYAAGHWNVIDDQLNTNLSGQSNGYQAIFESYWSQGWFAGGFVWKWFYNHDYAGGSTDKNFTPQNKPAQKILKIWYSKYQMK